MPDGGIEEGAWKAGEVGDDHGTTACAGFMQPIEHLSGSAPAAFVAQVAVGLFPCVVDFGAFTEGRIGERNLSILMDIDGIHGAVP